MRQETERRGERRSREKEGWEKVKEARQEEKKRIQQLSALGLQSPTSYRSLIHQAPFCPASYQVSHLKLLRPSASLALKL